jgi:DNA helicase II / ATP-dependent DNA helicase PcrA
MIITPSKEQIAVFHHINNSNKNLIVSAVAGSGKTTTLLEALNRIPENKTVLFMAFNKAISEELIKKAPRRSNILIKTVHGFGYSLLLDYNEEIKTNFFKYNNIFRNVLDYNRDNNFESIKKYEFKSSELKLIEKIKTIINNNIEIDSEFNIDEYITRVIDLCDIARLYNIGIREKKKLNDLAIRYSILNTYNESESAIILMRLGVHYTKEIDFTDMIYLPNVLKLSCPTFDYVFIDESQDLNVCQRLIMLKAIKKGGKFVAVGDPGQAIYGFGGADIESYEKLCQIPNTEQLPLSTTFRCPNKVIDLVRPLNDQIQPFESNPEGEIIESASYNDIKDGDMILCRQTFPIVSLCMKYLSQSIPAYIIGSDIGKSLISMITKNERKTEEYIMENVFARLDKEYDKIVEKLMSSHKLTQNEAENQTISVSFREKVMAIESIAGGLTDPNEVINKINKMFSNDNKKGICLSTIHKAKGLENDRIFILMPELMPSQYAKEQWELIQEDNLRYVAYTRAKNVLGFISDYDAYRDVINAPRVKTEIKDSKHVGIVGEFKHLTLKIVNIKTLKSQFGNEDVKLYEMIDKDGNLFKKWGNIKSKYIIGSGFSIDINTNVSFMGKIKSHNEYKGIKETIISNIM